MKNKKTRWPIKNPETPYEKAIYIWDIRVGSVLSRAKNWRFFALLILLLCIVEGILAVRLLATPKVIPYVIEVSDSGKVINYGRINKYENYTLDDSILQYYVVNFIKNIREIDNNVPVEKRKWNDAYAYVTTKGGEELTHLYNQWQPLTLAEAQRSEITVNSYINRTAATKEIWFSETVYDLKGNPVDVKKYKGVIQIVLSKDGQSEKNPLGIYFDTIVIGDL